MRAVTVFRETSRYRGVRLGAVQHKRGTGTTEAAAGQFHARGPRKLGPNDALWCRGASKRLSGARGGTGSAPGRYRPAG